MNMEYGLKSSVVSNNLSGQNLSWQSNFVNQALPLLAKEGLGEVSNR